MTDVPLTAQLSIVKQERQIWLNTRWQIQSRMKAVQGLIAKKILTEDDKKPVLDELTKIEAWIAEYDEQITEIEAAIKAESALADNSITEAPAPSENGKRAIKETI